MTGKDFEQLCENCSKYRSLKLQFNIILGVVTIIGFPFFSWLALTVVDIGKKVETGNELFNRTIPKIELKIHDIEDRERTNAISINQTYHRIENMLKEMKSKK